MSRFFSQANVRTWSTWRSTHWPRSQTTLLLMTARHESKSLSGVNCPRFFASLQKCPVLDELITETVYGVVGRQKLIDAILMVAGRVTKLTLSHHEDLLAFPDVVSLSIKKVTPAILPMKFINLWHLAIESIDGVVDPRLIQRLTGLTKLDLSLESNQRRYLAALVDSNRGLEDFTLHKLTRKTSNSWCALN